MKTLNTFNRRSLHKIIKHHNLDRVWKILFLVYEPTCSKNHLAYRNESYVYNRNVLRCEKGDLCSHTVRADDRCSHTVCADDRCSHTVRADDRCSHTVRADERSSEKIENTKITKRIGNERVLAEIYQTVY